MDKDNKLHLAPSEMKVGFIHYFNKIDKPKAKDYEPMSFEMWKMYRELEPTKFTLNYENYINIKENMFKDDLKKYENCKLQLLFYRYSVKNFDLLKTKEEINKIENNPLFDRWVDDKFVEELKEYEL